MLCYKNYNKIVNIVGMDKEQQNLKQDAHDHPITQRSTVWATESVVK
jgi:hypothetical protein